MQTVTHPSTNRARRRVTSLIETNALSLSEAATLIKPGIERVQALAHISRSALCCHSNETCAPIANPPNNAQLNNNNNNNPICKAPECQKTSVALKGTTYHSPKLHPGLCSSVGTRRGTDRHTDTHTDRRLWPLYIPLRLHHTRNVMMACQSHES